MEKFDFEKFRELDSLDSMEYIVKYEKKTGRQFSEKEIYNLYNCEEEHFFFRERNIKDIMKMKFCRYITYVVKNEQSYVSAFVREFVMRKNEIVIFGITEEEKEGLLKFSKAGIEIDNILNSIELQKYSSVLFVGNARLITNSEKMCKLYYAKYKKKSTGDVVAVSIDEKI